MGQNMHIYLAFITVPLHVAQGGEMRRGKGVLGRLWASKSAEAAGHCLSD
jgi:hypothetical protein